ncbi:unnamed protein product [Ectocarpus sp. CCAP 1310/34]|nr:unnamed protein product [Ectocarpus sp. CCAP 1310/34]
MLRRDIKIAGEARVIKHSWRPHARGYHLTFTLLRKGTEAAATKAIGLWWMTSRALYVWPESMLMTLKNGLLNVARRNRKEPPPDLLPLLRWVLLLPNEVQG